MGGCSTRLFAYRSVRLDADRADEFGEMGRAFNAMADAVEGHELRTSLTILRSQVEGLRVGCWRRPARRWARWTRRWAA
jgi:methyl-accepting chemotaxis protein